MFREGVQASLPDRRIETIGYGSTISNLRILVHPFFNYASDVYPLETRQVLLANILSRMVPQSETDITLVMPNVALTRDGRWSRRDLALERREIAKMKLFDPDAPTWKDVYRGLRTGVARHLRRNVLHVKDIVASSVFTSTMIVAWLTQKGMSLTEDTIVTFGGESRGDCVAFAALFFLQSTNIREVKIDKKASLPWYRGRNTNPQQDDITELFEPWYTAENQEDYFVIRKPEVTKS